MSTVECTPSAAMAALPLSAAAVNLASAIVALQRSAT